MSVDHLPAPIVPDVAYGGRHGEFFLLKGELERMLEGLACVRNDGLRLRLTESTIYYV